MLDEWSRESLAIEVDVSLTGERVARVVERLRVERGLPLVIQADNGPELRGRVLDQWAYEHGVKLQFIAPGKPIQNAYIESFHDKLRDECLNREIFGSLWEARVVIEQWRLYYNAERPHSSLGYQTPNEFAGRGIGSSGLRSGLPSLRPELPNKSSNQWQDSTNEVSTDWGQVTFTGIRL